MSLGLGTSLSKSGLITPGIVTDSLVLKHNYAAGAVVPVSDGAAYLNISNKDYIDCGTGIGTSLGNNYDAGLSVTLWFKANTIGADGLFSLEDDFNTGDYDFTIKLHGGGTIDLTTGLATSGAGVSSSTAFTDTSSWHHVAGVYDGANNKQYLYLDGASPVETAQSVSGGLDLLGLGSGLKTIIGGYYNENYTLDGYICNVGIWTGALTQPQIKSIMWKNFAGLSDTEKELGLYSWYDLSENANDPQGGQNGTLI